MGQKHQKTNWITVTGAPSSGKTSVVNELERRGYAVQHEASRAVIEGHLDDGLTLRDLLNDQQKLQKDISACEIGRQNNRDPSKIIFLDRGMGDRVAYDRFLGIDETENFLASELYNCRAILIMDRLPLVKDGIRLENDEEAAQVDLQIERAYTDLGYKPVRIPVMDINKRVDYILQITGLIPRPILGNAFER